MRDYLIEELEWEYNNEYVKRASGVFPHLFRDFPSFISAYHNTPLTTIDPRTQRLNNFSGMYDNLAEVHSAMGHRRDVRMIVAGFDDNTLPPPLLIKQRTESMYVMSGNTRLAVASALRRTIYCKVLEYR